MSGETNPAAGSGSSWVREVGDEDFQAAVIERSHEVPVVVDFWAQWCGPCRILGPVLEKLAAEGGGSFVLAKIDVDRSPQVAQAFGVRSIPQVIGFRNGRPAAEFTGAVPEEAVRQFLRQLVPSEADRLVEEGDAVREREPDRAESLYRQALEEEASHEAARVGLAEVLMAGGDLEAARPLVATLEAAGPLSDRIEHLHSALEIAGLAPEGSEEELRAKLRENPEDGETLLDLGRLLASKRRFREALEALLEAARTDRSLAEGKAKDLMVAVFHAVGVRSELADEYRTKLTRLLY